MFFIAALATAFALAAQLTTIAAFAGCQKHAECSSPMSPAYFWRGACYPFLQRATPLPLTFLKQQINNASLSQKYRVKILTIAANTLQQFSPHLSIYRRIHKFDPISALRRLSKRQTKDLPSYDFHVNVSRIFRKMNDMHTRYIPPAPLNATVSLLGFTLGISYKARNRAPRFYVTDIVPGFTFLEDTFVRGVHVTHFNDVPVLAMAERIGLSGYAANAEAVRAFGTDALTNRVALLGELPEEQFASIRYHVGNVSRTVRVPWVLVILTGVDFMPSVDRKTDAGILDTESRFSARAIRVKRAGRTQIDVDDAFVNVLSAFVAHSAKGDIGVLTLPSFGIRATDALLAELMRLLKLMPKRGLVVDVRGNSVGLPDYAKAVTEMIFDKEIPALPMQMRASEVIERAFSDPDASAEMLFLLSCFRVANIDALKKKKRLTDPVSDVLTFFSLPPLPRQERVYNGPVITLTDARVYSAGDIFALLRKDLGASLVVGVDRTTAAGGAFAFNYNIFQAALPNVITKTLPGDGDFSTAFARFYRTGKLAGKLVEHFGISSDVRYYRSRNDLLNDDEDLFNCLARKLSQKKT